MNTILDMTLDFQTVIITSRTQFFPTDKDMPTETGIYKYIGNKKEQRFYKIYISPFNQKEIKRYIRRKYPVYKWWKRGKARAIVEKSPDLMVRPMLLANIHDLMKRKSPYVHTFEIYEELVTQWIQRERLKDKKELRRFSEVIARNMYEHQQDRGGLYINHDQFRKFAQEHGIELEELAMRSQSLLNRNAEGKYKFAHKSILEYLLSLELLRDSLLYQTFNFDNMELTQRFYQAQCYIKIVIPFFSQKLKGNFTLDMEGSHKTFNLEKIDIKNFDSKKFPFINIKELNLSENQITDITPLKELYRLKYIHLTGNPIKDTSFLVELRKKQIHH